MRCAQHVMSTYILCFQNIYTCPWLKLDKQEWCMKAIRLKIKIGTQTNTKCLFLLSMNNNHNEEIFWFCSKTCQFRSMIEIQTRLIFISFLCYYKFHILFVFSFMRYVQIHFLFVRQLFYLWYGYVMLAYPYQIIIYKGK